MLVVYAILNEDLYLLTFEIMLLGYFTQFARKEGKHVIIFRDFLLSVSKNAIDIVSVW